MSAVFAGIVPVEDEWAAGSTGCGSSKALVDFDFENLNANQEIVTDSAKATGTYGLQTAMREEERPYP